MLEWLEAHQLPCLFKIVFGMDCPGCGFQTAVLLLCQGRIAASFLAYPALGFLTLFLTLALLRVGGVKKIRFWMLKNVGFVCLIIILISYLLRLTAIDGIT